MIRVSEANKPDAVSVYDAFGNRVAEKVNDVSQFVIYDAFGKMVAEYGGNPQQDAGGVKYYLQDWQGSVRAGVNAGGFVKSRTDHQAFGEDIASGVGLRTTAQGFGAPQANRQGYGLTEKDSTGMNHTWFRKNESRAGRWTSPETGFSLDGVGHDLWYVDSGKKIYLSLVGGEKFEKGESPVITWVRSLFIELERSKPQKP